MLEKREMDDLVKKLHSSYGTTRKLRGSYGIAQDKLGRSSDYA